MGTNYYIVIDGPGTQTFHLCKLSYGWKPLFKASAHQNSVKEYVELIQATNAAIKDEWGETISLQLFSDMITIINDDSRSRNNIDIDHTDEDGFEFVKEEFS
jgi:hypothetical protein